MAPLTPQLLLQRGRPKTDRLGKIQSLNLSGLELLSEHLDPNLLGRLKKLKELDLSNNLLETLPANLGLSHLRILRCTNNQLGDVTALHQFPELEELSLEGNPFLTVSDNLKVSFLLPKLRKVNGKDTASTYSQVESLDRELTNRVTAHWQKFIATVSPEEEADKVQADFMRSAVRDVHYGPESLMEFTQWRPKLKKSLSEDKVSKMNMRTQGRGLVFISPHEKYEKPKDEQKEKLNIWVNNLDVFFVSVLFEAHKREEMLKEKVKENRLQQAMDQQKQIENEELEARLNILREEEARRQDFELDITVLKEPLEITSSQPLTPSPPKEDLASVQTSKASPGKKKKK